VDFEWRKFFDLAKQLQGQSNEEAQRSSISRAYYAVFCTARNHLKVKGFVFPETGEVHMGVWNRLKDSRMQCRDIGEIGDRLRRRRVKADYLDTLPNVEKEAQAAILDADEFFKLWPNRQNCP
jgi:uncharacterized protein (UPF0332 family)